ncbi:DsrE family protein [Acidihalobacter yilgarnensis]|uniref:DsrE family protein n=1 Tax=Acidihalobacter yilgarnensis TaxID=2819280 RepID=UPI0009F23A8D|nr:DsrE family protein [Acidihalobacter yilgarnensis]
MNRKIRLVLPVLALFAWAAFQPAQAENWSLFKNYNYDKPEFVHSLPFAKEHVVIQVSQADPKRWNLVLNNAANVLNYFGPDKVQVVVVAYGPGLKMLFKNSKMAARIQSLNAEGVEFDACHNTMLGFKKKLGHLPKLVDSAVVVPGGIVRIMQLEAHGFRYIKP